MRKYLIASIVLLALFLGIEEVREKYGNGGSTATNTDVTQPLFGGITPSAPRKRNQTLEFFQPNHEGDVSSEASLIELARTYLEAHNDEFKVQPHHQLKGHLFTSPIGNTVRFDVYQDGLPLFETFIDVEIDGQRQISSVTSHYDAFPRVDTQRAKILSQEEIQSKLSSRYVVKTGETPSMMLLPTGQGRDVEIVYVMQFTDREISGRNPMGNHVQLLLRASDGQILKKSFARVEFQSK